LARKSRLDALLVARGLAPDLAKARGLIMAGSVVVGEQRVDKPGAPVAEDAPVRVRGKGHDYVSRGALKLVHGLDHFAVPVDGRTCLDLGASTGGFTQVLLERGARRVYAVDVGRDQLAWALRQDARVVSLEQTHARDLTPAIIPEPIDLLVADVSFISLRQALPPVFPLLAAGADLVVLVKPQFEAQPGEVEDGGLVRDPAVHARTCAEVAATLEAARFTVRPAIACALRGATGNQEYLLAARRH
jgi:23S rRNA (cytidine1920-2'-O)/16S rRNA (cytidine1409-2'-O)-methyltransferase